MATDIARGQLELASGQNEITAPFHQTAPRRRLQRLEAEATSMSAISTQTRIEVPLAAARMPVPFADPELKHEQRGRTPWVAFAISMLSVGFAVWWVMAQRMPDIDPRDVIARNLDDARAAMADRRYTDPPERSALHYFSTVLAIDPGNADASAGIDAIADRNLTNARVLLSKGRVAEAGVALEKAHRVRPDHNGLAILDAQWRAELRRLLDAAATIAEAKADLTEELVVTAAPAPVPALQPTGPKLVKMVQPQYPQDALIRGIEGWVDVSLRVTAAGNVIDPRVEESDRGWWFDQAALIAVEQWKYEPRSDGITSERIRVRVKFQRSN